MTSIPSELRDLAKTATVLQVGSDWSLADYPEFHTIEDVFLTLEHESDPERALERLETTAIDCVVTDHELPKMDGLDLLTAIRSQYPALPIVLFPENGSEELASEAIASGVTGYVPRTSPDAGQQLVEQIAQATASYEHHQLTHQLDQNSAGVLEQLSDGIIVLDTEWTITYANEGAQKFFQRPPADLIGHTLQELTPAISTTSFYDHYHDVLDTGGSRRIEEYYEPQDRWYAEYIYPTDNGLTVVFRDITAQKERERELEETTAQLHALLDNVEAAVWIRDPDSRFVLLNQEYRTRYGISREQPVVGHPPETVVSDAIAAEIRARDQDVLERESSLTFEEKRLTTAGYQTYLTRITPLFDETGTVSATCGVSSEITTQKQTKQHLDVLNRILRHNLRNDMQIVHGYATELVTELDGPTQKLAEQIQDQSTELIDLANDAGMVNQLLSQPLDLQSLSLPAVLSTVVSNLRSEYPDAIITVDVPSTAIVAADRRLLTLVLENVLENGIEHTTSHPPQVHITTTKHTPNSRIELIVTDNGPGIPTHERTAVLDGTVSATTHSSGLGLWLIKWGIDRLGGTFTIEQCDDPGCGTRVRIRLRTELEQE
ncbi:receiver/sensor box histidine kinase (plasmid) [Natrialba magadii ATCC 43099]|uniref:histidine kinase n=1 Tax=Natrialba magadii (strain ATCC 43099 / DSM 3394 / CCM 3739 / CIP 104546 / IAM 13178 / JCM 8861 / NBRC 102185 / NCIMB 2190 / MS3) TaxID=547559 RepID=D3T123_NATMM|nr:PAS domain-containing protein [Natrialba magadii]ADD07282.1 receiver/sensor box histidine kinase [Natrialba magadii ATCC 43099]ELY32710.1 multi-sensor signal transduction histidine kinase [Natrialba magadii ATCC 43099]